MVLRVTTRNATFQQWQALLTNRTKRQRAGEFVVQGVRPLTLAAEHGWPVRSLLYPDGVPLSAWAQGMLDRVETKQFAVAPDLLRELGEKEDSEPELLGIVGQRPDDLARIPARPDLFVVVFDRPTAPGNLGTVIRSADAFGATGVVVTGHAADPYDPKAVRASTGSLFAVPVVRVDSHREVVGWAAEAGAQLLGADESGDVDLSGHDLTGPTVVVIGNETRGLSAGWRQACDRAVRIPMVGAASSLNAASAATVVLYESIRQRRPSR